MPGDPKECREHAKRCWKLTSGVSNPILKESLIDLAQRRARLASGLWPNRISYTFHWLRTRADRERQAPDQGHLTNSAPPNERGFCFDRAALCSTGNTPTLFH
jgi:hypothetical protein